MDNYKKYLFDQQFSAQDPSQKIFSFGGSAAGGQQQSSQQGDLAQYLDGSSNYDNQGSDGQFDDEYKKDFLKTQIKSLREKLIVMGFPPIGDLYNITNSEVQITVKSLFAIIQQRKQDMDFRNTIHDRLSKLENDKNILNQNLDRVNGQKKSLEQEFSQLQAKLKNQEKASKEQMTKLISEKDELQKAFLKIQNMKAQYEHEIKQRDLNLQKLQEHLKKAQGQKTVNFRNSFEITSQLEQTGPNLFSANGEFEFSQLVMKRWEEVNHRLQQENEHLKENLIKLHQELNEILNIRKEVFLKRRKIDYGEEFNQNIPPELEKPESQMIQFKQDLFKTPLDNNCKEAIQLLQENLQNFKELMKKFDQQYDIQMNEEEFGLEGDVQEIGKIRACKNLSDLFKNYNYIFETQDKMINQIISKSNGLKKLDELNYNVNRFNRVLDDKQIDDVRRYLQEQKVYLDESKNEMDLIKKQFQQQLKKREDEKQLIQIKKSQLEETNEKFKENIRQLQNASKQAIQNLIENEDFGSDKRILQENQLNDKY